MRQIRDLFSFLIPFESIALGGVASIEGKCSSTLSTSHPAPSMAAGYVAHLVANELKSPRDLLFDNKGNLLVVEAGKGVTALTLEEHGQGCISVKDRKSVVANTALNHGIELSRDGSTLYASSTEAAYSWGYSAKHLTTTSGPKTLVKNMTNSDHTTRTLLLPKSAPGTLIVSRGSTSNIDPLAEKKSSGHSQVKAFDLTQMEGPYDFDKDGVLLGWGLRNDVGVAEEPVYGGIFTVENSVDQMTREGVDIHNTNPAEEMNFLGYVNGKDSPNSGRNFGYPECFTAWNTSTIPKYNGKAGHQFAIGNLGPNNNDALCSEEHRQRARIAFHPHMAPLDILFNKAGDEAWVTFHGSWDSTPPVGYKVGVVKFKDGEPVEPVTSLTALTDIMSNANVQNCYSESCFRPVGLAWDKNGNLFVSSDATGEIYTILRKSGKPTNIADSS